jgi:pimeloyl-ACP methyl ester carboxylesterase
MKRSFGKIAVIVLTFVVCSCASTGKTQPYKDENGVLIQNSVAEIVYMDIGGVEQGMIIRGKNINNPVLLFLHGGPGSPEYPMTADHPLDLDDTFTIVWWEQRGTGISYHKNIPPESMTLEQFINDTAEVTNYLRQRFNQDKIYLMGHSWGTILGVYTVQQYPELYKAYIGIGQIANQLESEKLAYDYMLNTAIAEGNRSLEKKFRKYTLTTAESVLGKKYMQLRSETMNKQGIGLTHTLKSAYSEVVIPFLKTKEYTASQKLGLTRGINFTQKHLIHTIFAKKPMEDALSFEIPIYIIGGKYDYQVSSVLAKEYFDRISAPKKEFFLFENSAHSPLFEEPERLKAIILETILE